MPLHTDYRPQTLDDFVGNIPTIKSIKSIVEDEHRAHTYLFTGPAGCGKTTLAKILAKEIGCDKPIIINSSNNRGIDTARMIIEQCQYRELEGGIRVYILDEVHKTTNDFQNAMLQILETPPDHVYFLLCTTNQEKLLPAVLSRCTTFSVGPLPENRLQSLLQDVCEKEKIKLSPEILKTIAKKVEGVPRNALTALGKIRDISDVTEEQINELVLDSAVENSDVIKLCRKLLNPKAKWNHISVVIQGLTDDPERVRLAVLGYMSSVLLRTGDVQAAKVIDCFSNPFWNTGKAGLVLACYDSIQN